MLTPQVFGPISNLLLAELKKAVDTHNLVIWLDRQGQFGEFVEALKSVGPKYQILSFQGSYLELMLALAQITGDQEKPRLLLHLPNHTEKSVRETPVLGLYRAGFAFRRNLQSLVKDAASGLIVPDDIDAFIAAPGLTLEVADTWLKDGLSSHSDGFIGDLRNMSITEIADDLAARGSLWKTIKDTTAGQTLLTHLNATTGLTLAWCEFAVHNFCVQQGLSFALCSWALAVEYTDDLMRPPTSSELAPATRLAKGLTERNKELAVHLRQQSNNIYAAIADGTEGLLPKEVETATAGDLGEIDTFRFEEHVVLVAAIKELANREYAGASRWAALRLASDSYWVSTDPHRHTVWEMVAHAAALGMAIDEAGPHLDTTSGHESALAHYQRIGARVDRAHRKLEQLRFTKLLANLPAFDPLVEALNSVRSCWRDWADQWSCQYNEACQQVGFLPARSLQQRTLFDEVVRPLTLDGGITAYFVVDALRYEMAEWLKDELSKTPATKVSLKGRMAELPTVTEVGMNALAPVAPNNELSPVLKDGKVNGLQNGSFRVYNPKTRQKAMAGRVKGHTMPWLKLAEVKDADLSQLKRTISKARLVVVHSTEIDKSGENGAGLTMFETILRQLKSALRRLREAGVQKFVITADHGFLLLTGDMRSQSHGTTHTPSRRHHFTTSPSNHQDEAYTPLSALRYIGVEGGVVFPKSTATFKVPKTQMDFVHGGNSLQERIIPVLIITHKHNRVGSDNMVYEITGKRGKGSDLLHAVEAMVSVGDQGGLAFSGAKTIPLSLVTPKRPNVIIELHHIYGGAKLTDNQIIATVGEPFTILFRLRSQSPVPVVIALEHSGQEYNVNPFTLPSPLTVTRSQFGNEHAPTVIEMGDDWLNALPEGPVRRVFEHIDRHGSITTPELVNLLGSPRAARRFDKNLSDHCELTPFGVSVQTENSVKRYTKTQG